MKRAAPIIAAATEPPAGLRGPPSALGALSDRASFQATGPVPPGAPAPGPPRHPPQPLARSVVLVGLMGAGKTSVGRRLGKLLQARFTDADDEIVAAAGMSIADLFASYGEPTFRELERRVVARLVNDPPGVVALGGGAFVDPATRALIKKQALSVWLRADLETLVTRTAKRRAVRPLLAGDEPRAVLQRLMSERYPLYAEADLTVDTGAAPADHVAERVLAMILPLAT